MICGVFVFAFLLAIHQDIFPSQDLVIQTKYCKMILCGGRVCLTEQQNPGIKVKMKKWLYTAHRAVVRSVSSY